MTPDRGQKMKIFFLRDFTKILKENIQNQKAVLLEQPFNYDGIQIKIRRKEFDYLLFYHLHFFGRYFSAIGNKCIEIRTRF